MRLAEFLRKALELRLSDVRVAMPVEVTAYDLDAQTVDVKPLIKNLVEAEDGVALESLPVLTSVPMAFRRGGGFFTSYPIAKGDTGMIIVCDRSIDQWHKKGGEIEALDRRLHSFAGAVFYPDLADSKHPLADAHADNMVMGKDGGAQVHVKPDAVHLYEENAADFVALAAATKAEISALRETVNTFITVGYATHTHLYSPGPLAQAATLTPLPPGVPPAAVGDVKAAKVKAT